MTWECFNQPFKIQENGARAAQLIFLYRDEILTKKGK